MPDPDYLADIRSAAAMYAEVFGSAPEHALMGRTIADELGVEGEPVQMIPEEHDGLTWWRTVFPERNGDGEDR